jgi:starch synthase (maltosyl-transferring)
VHGGRPAHIVRFVLAATLSSAYGVYGPPYEHVVHNQHPDREEYADNEKYEIRVWNWNDPNSLQPLMKRINRIRRDNAALHFMRNLTFHTTDNPHLIAYSKRTGDNVVLCVVNLDPYNVQSGWMALDLEALHVEAGRPFEVHDQLGGERYRWTGPHNYVELNPHTMPAHIFRVHTRRRTERDFEYFA